MRWSWYVYVIECGDGLYYTGLTWNLRSRLEQHRSGSGSRFTKRHRFKALKYAEEFDDFYDAWKRERQIKDFSRKKKEALWYSTEFSLRSNKND